MHQKVAAIEGGVFPFSHSRYLQTEMDLTMPAVGLRWSCKAPSNRCRCDGEHLVSCMNTVKYFVSSMFRSAHKIFCILVLQEISASI